jgi:hypothetical protein
MRVPTSFWLFLVLTLLTCVVAYWADNLGKNLGKKRISLFGLRPRQTATLLSMASSVAIMLITLLALTYLSQDFKNAVFRSDRLNLSNEKLRRQNTKLERQRDTFNARLLNLQKEVTQSQKASAAANKAREAASRDADEAANKTRAAQAKFASTRAELTSAQASLDAAKNAAQSARSSLTTARQSERAARVKERTAQESFKKAQQKARDTEQQAHEAEQQAKLAGEQKEQAQSQAKKARREASKARDNLDEAQEILREARRNLLTAQTKTLEIARENAQAQNIKEQMEAQIGNLRLRSAQIVNAFVTNNILVTVGQVFAERIVQPGGSVSELQTELNLLQNEALDQLRKPPIAASSAELLPLPAMINGLEEPVDAERLQRILIEGLREIQTPVAVRWVAARNHAVGEKQIDGRLVPIAVRVVAPQGTVLAQVIVAGRQSDARVFSQLLALTDSARNAAKTRGVDPPLSPQMPNFFAAGTNDRVFAALRDIQARDGNSRVRLIADAPLTTVAPPQVRFLIEDAPENETSELESGASTRTSE